LQVFDSAIRSGEFVERAVNILGFPFDGTACYRKGARLGPIHIREASANIETYSPYLNRDTQDLDAFYDLGDLRISSQDENGWAKGNEHFLSLLSHKSLKQDQIKIMTLGGEHSISYFPIKSYLENYSDLVLLHLDAHADLRDGYQGYHYSHASIIRRVVDHFQEGHSLIQYGIRSGTKSEFCWMEENKTRMKSLDQLVETLIFLDAKRPIYLTLDLDFFDPAYFPGTGTPEPGGESFHTFIKILKILDKKNFIGVDITELAPEIDPTGNSSVFAAKVIRELLLVLGK
jgi:agmatinase